MRRPRRLAALAALALAGAAGAVLAPSSQGDATFEVDVVFDDSRGLLVGQLVQVAGARVGSITDVSVTPDYKARIHMEIDRRFAPFRADATCMIKPSGLIAENYVQCDPGTPDAPPLEATGGHPPTVGVENTTQPVSLTDLFEVWNTPTHQRLGVLLSTLGIATSGHGEDINAILRRANPTLALARRTIALLERQRDELAAIVDRSGAVAHALAERPERLTRLVRHAAGVATRAAERRDALAAGVQRLPALLEEATPALARLDALSAAARPLMDELGDAAPGLNRLSADVPRLARTARPVLAELAPVLRAGAATARRAAPLAEATAGYARASLPATATAAALFGTLEQRGFLRDLLVFFYNATLATARYDDQGHLIPAHVTLSPCGQYAKVPDPGCGAPDAPAREESERGPRARERGPRVPEPETPRAQERPRERLPELPELPDAPRLPELPALDDLPDLPLLPDRPRAPAPDTVDDLLDFLFG